MRKQQQEEEWGLFFSRDLTFLCVAVETESGEPEEHQPGHAESAGGVCAWTRRHRKDQNPGQGNIQQPLGGLSSLLTAKRFAFSQVC